MAKLGSILRAITKPLDDCFCCTDSFEVRAHLNLLVEQSGPSASTVPSGT